MSLENKSSQIVFSKITQKKLHLKQAGTKQTVVNKSQYNILQLQRNSKVLIYNYCNVETIENYDYGNVHVRTFFSSLNILRIMYTCNKNTATITTMLIHDQTLIRSKFRSTIPRSLASNTRRSDCT